MANSVDSQINANQYAPEEIQDYSTWLIDNDVLDRGEGSAGPWASFFRLFFGGNKRNEQNYQAYVDNITAKNKWKATQYANAYQEALSNSAIQRQLNDLKRAGLNPYLLLNNGSVSGASVPSSAKADYETNGYLSKQDSGRNTALMLLALVKIAAALL